MNEVRKMTIETAVVALVLAAVVASMVSRKIGSMILVGVSVILAAVFFGPLICTASIVVAITGEVVLSYWLLRDYSTSVRRWMLVSAPIFVLMLVLVVITSSTWALVLVLLSLAGAIILIVPSIYNQIVVNQEACFWWL